MENICENVTFPLINSYIELLDLEDNYNYGVMYKDLIIYDYAKSDLELNEDN